MPSLARCLFVKPFFCRVDALRLFSVTAGFLVNVTCFLCTRWLHNFAPNETSQAFAYLKVVEEAVSSAVAPLGKGRSGAVRKAASHALIQSINT